MHCLPIFLDTELNSLFYNGYCKSILSPVLHGCTMVYDDAEDSFSWQKNTATALTYQNAYRRVNNVFAQEILKYCQQLRVLEDECVSDRGVRNSPIIWINGYQLMLLPRDLRLYMENMNRKCARSMVLMTSHSITPAPTAVPNLYVSGSLATPRSHAAPSESASLSPFSPSEESPSSLGEEDDRSSLFSPGPTFVDNIEDDMDDERMRVSDGRGPEL